MIVDKWYNPRGRALDISSGASPGEIIQIITPLHMS